MNWSMFYLICFGLGLGLTILSFAGGFHHHFHIGLHHSAHAGHVPTAQQRGASPLNGFTLTAFLCWFGGAGYLLEKYAGFAVPAVMALATAGGIAGGGLVFWFLAKVIAPHDKPLTAEDTEMTGVVGRVIGTIRPEGVGEILFSQNGIRRSSPARSENGEPIAREVEVVVMRYERGIAWVRRWDEIVGGEAHAQNL